MHFPHAFRSFVNVSTTPSRGDYNISILCVRRASLVCKQKREEKEYEISG